MGNGKTECNRVFGLTRFQTDPLLPNKNKRQTAYYAIYLSKSCGGKTRTYDLWVMSPTSYQLLHSAMFP